MVKSFDVAFGGSGRERRRENSTLRGRLGRGAVRVAGAGAGRGGGLRRHRVDHRRHGAGPAHDPAGLGDVLRWAGAIAGGAVGRRPLLRHRLLLQRALARRRLQHLVRGIGRRPVRRPRQGVLLRRDARRPVAGHGHPGSRLRRLPDDLRHHHPGADRRRLCGAHQIPGGADGERRVAPGRLFADLPLGVGRRLALRSRRDGLRRRLGGASERRRLGARHRRAARLQARLSQRDPPARTTPA